MKCEKFEKFLSPYLEDELNLEEKNVIEMHLKVCKSCSDLLTLMKETKESLTHFPELEVSENLLSRLYSIPDKKKRFKLSFDFLLRPSLQPILAAATILLIIISFYAFNPNRKFINKSINRQIHLGYSKIEKLYARAESFTDNLGFYKDNILVSLEKAKFLGENED